MAIILDALDLGRPGMKSQVDREPAYQENPRPNWVTGVVPGPWEPSGPDRRDAVGEGQASQLSEPRGSGGGSGGRGRGGSPWGCASG